MNVSRREFFSILGAGTAAATLPGCLCPSAARATRAKIALQLYSIHTYIGGTKDKATGKVLSPGVGLERALEDIAAIGYRGVEFAGYYGHDATGSARRSRTQASRPAASTSKRRTTASTPRPEHSTPT